MIADLIDDFTNTLRSKLNDEWIRTDSEALGLDCRAYCHSVWVSEEGMPVVRGHTRAS